MATDRGRLVMVPVALAFAGLAAARLGSPVPGQHPLLLAVARDVGILLTVAFYLLVVSVYLRRGAAIATNSSRLAKTVALLGSWLPLAFPAGTSRHLPVAVLSDALVAAGLAWCVVSLRALGRSFSVVPQARELVSTGTYRWVRHPLYLGELVACLGFALRAPSVLSFGLWLLLLVLQLARTRYEEATLGAALPEYAGYRRSTYRLVPGLV